jgi:O-acetyl-ADP-ribose deacetylase (regulator of RNase III)
MHNVVIASKTYATLREFNLVQGDLTQEKVGAIVNAANPNLLHGAGVAALIVRAGGRIIQEESTTWVMQHGPITHHTTATTSAGSLPADYVIHAVGPVWGSGEEALKLNACVQAALRSAKALGVQSLALPAISTGIFGYPVAEAARVILSAIDQHFEPHPDSSLLEVRMVVYDETATETFLHVWEDLFSA